MSVCFVVFCVYFVCLDARLVVYSFVRLVVYFLYSFIWLVVCFVFSFPFPSRAGYLFYFIFCLVFFPLFFRFDVTGYCFSGVHYFVCLLAHIEVYSFVRSFC